MQYYLHVKDLPPENSNEKGRKQFIRTLKEEYKDFRRATEAERIQSFRFLDTAYKVFTVPVY